MAKKKLNINKIKTSYLILVFIFTVFTIFTGRLIYLCTYDYNVGNKTITAFIKNRNTEEETIAPKRGSVKDKEGNILAEDVASYTLIAYLDKKRSENSKTPQHVVDVEATANALAPLLNVDVKVLKTILSRDAYQVELGAAGRNLSQIEMETIRNLNLPGIDFITKSKRYYPNGDFASYTIGYTTTEEDEEGNEIEVGGLGIEEYFNETLTGTKGYVTYEKDRYGYKIANGREYKKDADDGEDIYLTLDSNIQLFTENAIKKMQQDSESEWSFMIVADAKTGAILSYATTPSFDPNKRNMTSYINPIIGYTYEPGSTMKIFSYMCAVENGNYDGTATFKSGSITYEASDGTKTTIHDWNKVGWGEITYDYGFAQSSNVGASNLLEQKIITKKTYSECLAKYNFGKVTDFTLNREAKGSVKFNYDIDAASATFGQGITITPIQMIQALTSLSNDGKMLKPYIINKIVDTDTNETSYEATTEVMDTIASSATTTKIKELMQSVVCSDATKCTGNAYYMEDYPIIGKTGTAQIYDEKTGTYMTGESDFIYSFAGLYPANNPQIIIYTATKKPKDTTNYLAPAIKDVVVNTSKHLNITIDETTSTTYQIKNYINKEVSSIQPSLEKNNLKLYILGTGAKIIQQYPQKNTNLYSGSVVALLTDNYDKKMPNLIGLSYKDARNILQLMNVKYSVTGKGYVTSQSVKEGEFVTDSVAITLN